MPGNSAVSEQTWGQSDLETDPVFTLSDVQHISGVCRTSYVMSVAVYNISSKGKLVGQTLMFLGTLDLFS